MTDANARRRIIGGSFGNFVEMYDFFVYGFSVPILASHFFRPATLPRGCSVRSRSTRPRS